jgi:hypothetical protein
MVHAASEGSFSLKVSKVRAMPERHGWRALTLPRGFTGQRKIQALPYSCL